MWLMRNTCVAREPCKCRSRATQVSYNRLKNSLFFQVKTMPSETLSASASSAIQLQASRTFFGTGTTGKPKNELSLRRIISKRIQTMAHHLNTNKQFMIGNGILAFAVILVVVIFVYMSMRLQREKEGERYFAETYNITLVRGFAGDSVSILINDSLLERRTIDTEPFSLSVKRFSEQSALMIVDNATDKLSLFELSEKGGDYHFEKEGEEVKLLSQE